MPNTVRYQRVRGEQDILISTKISREKAKLPQVLAWAADESNAIIRELNTHGHIPALDVKPQFEHERATETGKIQSAFIQIDSVRLAFSRVEADASQTSNATLTGRQRFLQHAASEPHAKRIPCPGAKPPHDI